MSYSQRKVISGITQLKNSILFTIFIYNSSFIPIVIPVANDTWKPVEGNRNIDSRYPPFKKSLVKHPKLSCPDCFFYSILLNAVDCTVHCVLEALVHKKNYWMFNMIFAGTRFWDYRTQNVILNFKHIPTFFLERKPKTHQAKFFSAFLDTSFL